MEPATRVPNVKDDRERIRHCILCCRCQTTCSSAAEIPALSTELVACSPVAWLRVDYSEIALHDVRALVPVQNLASAGRSDPGRRSNQNCRDRVSCAVLNQEGRLGSGHHCADLAERDLASLALARDGLDLHKLFGAIGALLLKSQVQARRGRSCCTEVVVQHGET